MPEHLLVSQINPGSGIVERDQSFHRLLGFACMDERSSDMLLEETADSAGSRTAAAHTEDWLGCRDDLGSNPVVGWGLEIGQSLAVVDRRWVVERWRGSLGRIEDRQYSPDADYRTQSSI